MTDTSYHVLDQCFCDGNGWAPCWQCGGAGGFHDCGEDTCCCLDKGDLNEVCDECNGRGGFCCPACAEDWGID